MFTNGEDTFEWLQKKNLFFRVKISLIKSIKLVWDKFYSKSTINSYFSNMKGLYWKSKMVCKKGEEGKEIDISFAMFWENLRADGHFLPWYSLFGEVARM